jgi:hypothetical protein
LQHVGEQPCHKPKKTRSHYGLGGWPVMSDEPGNHVHAGDEPSGTHSDGPGPFITRVVRRDASGQQFVFTSRRHRKGLGPLVYTPEGTLRRQTVGAHPWLQLWAPARLSWWIAWLFIIGSAHFALGGLLATYPHVLPKALHAAIVTNAIFFIGSLFFTGAAYLQLLQVTNADVADLTSRMRHHSKSWRWFAWRPKNAGYLASLIQFAGTVFFNLNTADAMLSGLGWEGEDILVWTPNMLGCICFLVASYLAYMEVSHTRWSFQPNQVSWWVAISNLLGSVAFQISALFSVTLPGPADVEAQWYASFYTLLGGIGFLVGSYLMLPELFDADGSEVKN